MNALDAILYHPILERLGWGLVHSLWQAAAVAGALAVVLILLRKASANARYGVACFALVLMVLLPVVTVFTVKVPDHPVPASQPAPSPETSVTVEYPAGAAPMVEYETAADVTLPAPDAPAPSWQQSWSSRLETALPYLVLVWLVGVFGLSLWHLGGWAQLQRLKRRMVEPVGRELSDRAGELMVRLGIRRAVRVVRSALVQVPTVVGWLKPVILIPAGALTGLMAPELEALLAHELAHIRRHDYLVNILQTVVEILGFYHPAVWWVSRRIRIERENCCDDMAAAVTGDRVLYARALATMEELRGRQGLALAASGGSLFDRIRRLAGKEREGSGFSGWLPALAAGLVAVTVVGVMMTPHRSDAEVETAEMVESDAATYLREPAGVPQTRSPSENAEFGPVIERVVNDKDEGQDNAIDLDTGRLLTLPKDLLDDKTAAMQWVRGAGVDAVGETSANVRGLICQGIAFQRIANEQWDELAVSQLLQEAELMFGHHAEGGVLTPRDGVPATFLFSTREGGVGMLQILDLGPQGIKIRYKLVQGVTVAPFGAEPETLVDPRLFGSYIFDVKTTLDYLRGTGAFTEETLQNLQAKMEGVKVTHREGKMILERDGKTSERPIRVAKVTPEYTVITEELYPASAEELDPNAWLRSRLSFAPDGYWVTTYYPEPFKLKFRRVEQERGEDSAMSAPERREQTPQAASSAPEPVSLEFRLAEFTPADGLTEASVDGKDDTVWLHDEILLSGQDVESAKVVERNGQHPVKILFTEEGGRKFSEITRENVDKRLAIIVNGKIMSAPVIREEIRGRKAEISGSFSRDEAERIAAGLSKKPWPEEKPEQTPFGPVMERTVNETRVMQNCFIDFDTGELIDVQQEQAEGVEEGLAWLRGRGIDAAFNYETKNLMGIDMIAIEVQPSAWTTMPALNNPPFPDGVPGTPCNMSAKGALPATFIFKTREGSRGILQILGFVDEPQGARIRYKIVQGEQPQGQSELEQAIRSAAAKGDEITFEIREDGSMAMGDRVVTLEEIRAVPRLDPLTAKKLPVTIRAHRSTPHAQLVALMDACAKLNLYELSFAVADEEADTAPDPERLSLRVTDTSGNTNDLFQAYFTSGKVDRSLDLRCFDGAGVLDIPWSRISTVTIPIWDRKKDSVNPKAIVVLRDGGTQEYWTVGSGMTLVGATELGRYQIDMKRVREITNLAEPEQ